MMIMIIMMKLLQLLTTVAIAWADPEGGGGALSMVIGRSSLPHYLKKKNVVGDAEINPLWQNFLDLRMNRPLDKSA